MYRISKVETGRRLRKLLDWHGVTVREIQEEMGLESPQAIYKWLNGRALPSIENLLILGRLLNVPMEDIERTPDTTALFVSSSASEESIPFMF